VPAFSPVAQSWDGAGVRVAVAPFEILASRGNAGPCGRALCLSLTAGLTNLDGVEAVAHALCSDLPLREMAAEFRLTHLIQGSVIGGRDGLRVIVNLIQLADGTQLWAEEFDLGREESLATHSMVVGAVAGEVAGRLSSGRKQCALAMAA